MASSDNHFRSTGNRCGYEVKHMNGLLTDFDSQTKGTDEKQVFLLEDSDDDAAIFLRAVRGRSPNVVVNRATSVKQARFLLWDASPDLITLDYHLPDECGLNLLRDIRAHHRLRHVPVVILSGTENEDDVDAAYDLGANSFLKKPVSVEEYMDSVSLLASYWLDKNYRSALHRSEPFVDKSFGSVH
jgi:two-component system response regulator